MGVADAHIYGIVYRGLHCKTDAGLSDSFDLNAGLHQGSVLITLLSPVRQEVVCLPSGCMLMT